MGWASERKAIEARMSANWATTPIKYENAPLQELTAAHIGLFIRPGDRAQVTLGSNPTIRSISIIIVQIFVPQESGLVLARTYADTIAAIFDRLQFMTDDNDLISCQTASIDVVGESGGMYQVNLTVPYSRNEH